MTYPLYPARKTTDLSGFWDFLFLPHPMMELKNLDSPAGFSYYDKQTVPGCFDAAGTYAGQRGIGVYRRSVAVSEAGTALLSFGGLLQCGKIFWDGKLMLEHCLPYTGGTCAFETTAGVHELVIAVTNRFDLEYNPLTRPNYDFYAFGGILRSITLTEHAPSAGFIRCGVAVLAPEQGTVRLSPGISGIPDGTVLDLSVAFDGGTPEIFPVTIRNMGCTVNAQVPDPAIWSPESPNLHTVELRLNYNGCTDVIVERFGLRTIEAKNGKLLLNGNPVYLAGYNRHESHPETGAEIPRQIMMEDLQILRSQNCNFIRGCHYPQSQEFLDLCDEMGFLVMEESLGWGNGTDSLNDEKFCCRQEEQTGLMVQNSINHPCVILWGFLNETHSHLPESRALVERLAKAVRDIDRSRPLTFATMCIGYGEQCLDLVDVIACNTYPGWYEVQHNEEKPVQKIAPRLDTVIAETEQFKDKPLIISEIGAAALYGCHDPRFRNQWTEEFQADYIEEVIRCLKERPRIQGLALWHFADARTYTGGPSLNRARGFNNKGTLDEYRREKLAASIVRKNFAKEPFCGKKK